MKIFLFKNFFFFQSVVMKKSLFIFLICPFLTAEFSYQGQFRAAIGEVFSIEIDTPTSSHEFTAGEITANNTSNTLMGSFIVTINDNTTLGTLETNSVILESIVSTGSVVEIGRINQGTDESRIELFIQDDRNSSGSLSPTTIVNNQSIRDRTGPSAPNIVNENHTLTYYAKEDTLAGKPAGNYRTMIYFVLQQP